VPPQTVKAPNGHGVFTATVVEKGAKKTMTWHLTFARLSGPATAAHIHKAGKGKSGPVIVPLCGPCKSGAHGTIAVIESTVNAIEKGLAYVNVHTAKNPAGEIRGQLAVTS
jgi:hypothetical protein